VRCVVGGRYKIVQKNIELDKKITYGSGLNLLFFGPSGTGKTMLAVSET
jgi:DNA replication protein DnaC